MGVDSFPPPPLPPQLHTPPILSLNTHHQPLWSLQARILESLVRALHKGSERVSDSPRSPSEGFAWHSPLAPLSRGEQEGSGVAPTDRDPSPVGGRARAWRASLTLAVGPGSRTSCATQLSCGSAAGRSGLHELGRGGAGQPSPTAPCLPYRVQSCRGRMPRFPRPNLASAFTWRLASKVQSPRS